MKKLSVALVMTISLAAFPARASVHGGGNPRPNGSGKIASKGAPIYWTSGMVVRVSAGSSIAGR
jgi:hypothetical protein